MSLKADLQEIDGVGEATAEKIVKIVAEHDSDADSEVDTRELKRVKGMLDRGSYRAARSRLGGLL